MYDECNKIIQSSILIGKKKQIFLHFAKLKSEMSEIVQNIKTDNIVLN